MVEEVFVEGEEVERAMLPFETDPPRQWIVSEGNTLDFALRQDLIADLFQHIVQCWVVEGLDLNHLANLTQIRAIFHELKSGMCENEESFGGVVGEILLPLVMCLLIRYRLVVRLLRICFGLFGSLLCSILRGLFPSILGLLHHFLFFSRPMVYHCLSLLLPPLFWLRFLLTIFACSAFLSPSVEF